MTRLLCRLVLYLLCFFTGITGAATPPSTLVILDDKTDTIDTTLKLEAFQARQNDLNIQQVSVVPYKNQFEPNNTAVTNYGYHDKDFWLRFDVTSDSTADWYLVIDHTVFGKAELFLLPHRSGRAETTTDSNKLFLAIKKHRTPAWRLRLPQNQVFSVYLRINSPKEPLIIPVKLRKINAFLAHSQYQYIFFTMIVTGIAVLAFYNLFLAFFLQDKSYLIFVAFILLLNFFIFRTANLFPSLFDLLISPKNTYYSGLALLTHASASYYWYTLHRNTNKWLEKFTWIISWLSVTGAIVAFFYYQYANVFLFLFIPSSLILPLLMTQAIMQGHRNARSSFLAMLCLMISIGMYAPLYTGYFPQYPLETFYIGHIGILLAILLFSLNHADRSRQLRSQAERAETNRKATHNFLTTMSHELRNPMHIVLGANALLKTTSLSLTQRNYLDSSELASQQMLSLVGDILDTARLHSDRPIKINKQPFNLHRLIADLEQLFCIQARQKQLDFIITTKDIPHSEVIGNSQRLNRILVNLIGNAIKYTDTGTITLAVNGSTEAHIDTQQNHIHFAVKDTGPGISPESQSMLFQPFFQADSSYSRNKEGAGLGLAISHKLVQQMGGDLKLHSTLNEGSCFYFSLNLSQHCNNKSNRSAVAIAQAIPPNDISDSSGSTHSDNKPKTSNTQQGLTPEKKPLSGKKVLLVDDGEINLMIGAKLLTLQGANVTTAASGAAALRYLEQEVSFDAVLMDISMPDIDGYQTTRRIRQNKKLRQLPVIALTAHAIDGEDERCLRAGMNDYLSKPFQTRHLVEVINKHCP